MRRKHWSAGGVQLYCGIRVGGDNVERVFWCDVNVLDLSSGERVRRRCCTDESLHVQYRVLFGVRRGNYMRRHCCVVRRVWGRELMRR